MGRRGLRQRGRGPLELDARELVQADHLDQRADLRLGAAQENRPAVGAQPAGQHRQVEHQRGIRERQLRQIHDHIVLGADGTRQRPPA
jgi:hypothetical protein